MTTPKVLIDAQWRPYHCATLVSPGFKSTPLADRMVPTMSSVSFDIVLEPSKTVMAESGYPLFLRRSIAQDPTQGTQFVPNEDARSNPVEGSNQCVHGNSGTIFPLPPRSYPTPPLPAAINCGVLKSDDVDCLNNLEQMIELMANRMYDELVSDPIGFFRNYKMAEAASNAAWGQALPGRIVDGVWDTVKGLGTVIKWGAGKVWDGVVATGSAIAHPVDTYYAAVQATSELMESIDRYATLAQEGINVLRDPEKREAVIDEIKKWLREQLAGVACAAADALVEMMLSPKPLAAQFGELSAAISQQVTEVAGQVAIMVLGDKGISKLALLSKAGKLGGLAEDFSAVMTRIGRRVSKVGKDKSKPHTPSPNDPPSKPPAKQNPDAQKKHDDAGGAEGKGGAAACKTGCNISGSPVNTAYGCKVLFGEEDLDFDLPAPLALPWQRTYTSDHAQTGWLGQGWSTPFSLQLQRVPGGLLLVDEQGRRIALPEPRPGEPYHSRFEQFVLAATEDGSFEIFAIWWRESSRPVEFNNPDVLRHTRFQFMGTLSVRLAAR